MNKKIKFDLKNGKTHEMGIDEMARWACLLEGIEYVSNKCDELKIDSKSNEWVKPLAFQKYIDERFEAMKHDLTVEAIMGRI